MKSPDEDMLANFGRLHMRMRRHFDRVLTEHGVSLAQTKALYLIRSEGGTLRAADIAERFGQAPRTITEALDVLEREGLIQRVPSPSDRRAKLLKITPAGEAALDKAEPLRRRLVQDMIGCLDQDERAAFGRILRKLLEWLPDEDPTARCG